MKSSSVFVCQNCGNESLRWQGQCPKCGEWNTLEEQAKSKESKIKVKNSRVASESSSLSGATQKLSDVKSTTFNRISTGFGEVDRVLGGGLLPGQVVLLAGEPGIGKSTLLLQIAAKIGGDRGEVDHIGSTLHESAVLYVAGEESASQIASRATRVGAMNDRIEILSETNVDNIISTLESRQNLGLLIIDSVQTMWTSELSSFAGSVAQIRESAARLTSAAKRLGIPTVLVGHVTKDGDIAGPKVLEHIVDTVLSFEGDGQHFYRLLRTTKNRFGAVFEVGVLEMVEKGLKEVSNPSDLFLGERLPNQSGSVVTVTLEGVRPLLIEIQALTQKTTFGYPRRTSSGVNINRVNLLLAVLERHCGVRTSDKDVYINVASGFTASEPAVDLAICAAVASSVVDKPIDPGTVVFGEVGLSGELRQVPQAGRRLNEAKKLGFTKNVSSEGYKSVHKALQGLIGQQKS